MSAQNRKYLVFFLNGALYALDLNHVAEVGDPPSLWPIPLTSPCVAGALNFHGDIVAALHLPMLMGLTNCDQPEKIIVLHKDVASLAFLVDTVVRIVSAEEVSFGPQPDGPFATATLVLPDGEAVQLDLERLVFEAEQLVQNGSITIKNSANGKNA